MGLQKKIIEFLPEIDDIRDNTLRERVVAVWMTAAGVGAKVICTKSLRQYPSEMIL